MTATSRRTDEIRVVGCRERLVGDVVIDDWRPPAKLEVEALPSLPSPPRRPRLSAAADKGARAGESQTDSEISQKAERLPAPPPRAPRPRRISQKPPSSPQLPRSLITAPAYWPI